MQPYFKSFFGATLLCLAFSSCNNTDENDPCIMTVEIQPTSTDIEFKAVVFDGAAPYTYQWTGGTAHVNGPDWRIIEADETVSLTVVDNLGCTASETHSPYACGTDATMTDADGNTYPAISIGNQCWTLYNVKVVGTILEVTDSATWATTTSPAWCYYNNDPAYLSYGRLYNWYAVQSGNLCPAGWHVPTLADWQQLENYLGDQLGGKMKETTGWDSPNTGATNSSGFTAKPSGYRSALSSNFTGLGQYTAFWSSTQATDSTAHFRALSFDSAWITTLTAKKRQGYSCRCVKD